MPKTRTVGVHEAKTHFSQLLREVGEGDEIIVTKGGTPVARLVPEARNPSVADSYGMFPDHFNLPDDFDDHQDELGDLFGLPK